MTATMLAMVIRAYGGAEMLEPAELPPPVPAAGQVLVRIRAVAVNPADAKWRAGLFAGFMPVGFPHILGYDIAGEVIGGAGWPIGAGVFGMLDPVTKGGYAEQVAVDAASLAAIPEGIDVVSAAAIPTAALTGLQLIETALDVMPGQRILVTGATGAVGRVALQVARARGATVIAGVRRGRSDEAIAVGADEVVVLGGDERPGASVDHVVDTVGGAVVVPVCVSVRPGGRIVTVATTPIPADGLAAVPEFFAVRPDGAALARLAAMTVAMPALIRVARTMPLTQAADAHRILERGGEGGKIVLLP